MSGTTLNPTTTVESANQNAQSVLMRLATGYRLSQMLRIVARLGVADLLLGARERIIAAGLAERCDVVEGDFFTSVPSGGQYYVLANVIHDWDDARASAILRNCAQAMAEGGYVLVIESVLPTGNDPHPGKSADLQMLVLTGGRERTEPEYRGLLEKSGFTSVRVLPTSTAVSVIEAERA
jgi:hypothetical protein